jgi:hypothetical protein
LRGPIESTQYTSIDYTQTLDDHLVRASIGTVGDALDNALAESFVDSYKTELIADRVWRSQAQLELATVKWVAWFNHDRLHSSLGDIPPVEFEHNHHAAVNALPISGSGSVAAISPRAANGGLERAALRRSASISSLQPKSLHPARSSLQAGSAQAAPTAVKRPSTACGLSEICG